MCREGAWAELTVKVTSVDAFRGAARKNKYTTYSFIIIIISYFNPFSDAPVFSGVFFLPLDLQKKQTAYESTLLPKRPLSPLLYD